MDGLGRLSNVSKWVKKISGQIGWVPKTVFPKLSTFLKKMNRVSIWLQMLGYFKNTLIFVNFLKIILGDFWPIGPVRDNVLPDLTHSYIRWVKISRFGAAFYSIVILSIISSFICKLTYLPIVSDIPWATNRAVQRVYGEGEVNSRGGSSKHNIKQRIVHCGNRQQWCHQYLLQ